MAKVDLNDKLSKLREKTKEKRQRVLALAGEMEERDLNSDELAEMETLEREIGELEEQGTACQRALKVGNFSPDGGDIGLSDKEKRDYSVVRLIRHMAQPNDKKLADEAGLELEASVAVAQKRGMSAQGAFIPEEISGSWKTAEQRAIQQMRELRDLNVGTGTAGGNMVATEMMGIIELLRNALSLGAAGVTVVDGLVGDVTFPKQTGAATGYWISTEGGAPTESQQTVGQVNLTPKTAGAFTDYSRKLMLQSSVAVEQFVRQDLAAVLARTLDLAGLYGSGSSGQPTGLANLGSVGSVSFSTSAAPIWSEILEMRAAIAQDNAMIGDPAFIAESVLVSTLMGTSKDSGSGMFIIGENGTMMNRPVVESNQVTDGDLWLGVWAQYIMGLWGALDILVDPYTASTTGTTRVVALQSVDFGCRHQEAFCLGQ